VAEVPKLYLLIGMIASGKSTYARRRADEGALVISHDDLVQMLHARYRYEPALKPAYRAMMRELAREGIAAGRDVVIDRTHLGRDSRAFWVRSAGRWATEIVAVVFPVEAPCYHADRRFAHDARGRSYEDWLKAACYHAAQAEAEPLDWRSEGFSACIEVDPSPTGALTP
jgi:predicted kinase